MTAEEFAKMAIGEWLDVHDMVRLARNNGFELTTKRASVIRTTIIRLDRYVIDTCYRGKVMLFKVVEIEKPNQRFQDRIKALKTYLDKNGRTHSYPLMGEMFGLSQSTVLEYCERWKIDEPKLIVTRRNKVQRNPIRLNKSKTERVIDSIWR